MRSREVLKEFDRVRIKAMTLSSHSYMESDVNDELKNLLEALQIAEAEIEEKTLQEGLTDIVISQLQKQVKTLEGILESRDKEIAELKEEMDKNKRIVLNSKSQRKICEIQDSEIQSLKEEIERLKAQIKSI